MEVSKLEVPQKRAEELYQECREALKDHESDYVKELRRLYNQLRKKKRIIDVFASMKKAGLNEEGDPKLAIAPATQKHAYFRKDKDGAGAFRRLTDKRYETLRDDISIPTGTFPDLETETTPWNTQTIKKPNIKTLAPCVPPKLLLLIPKHHTLKNYHVLFEAEKWTLHHPPKDPILMKKVTANLFVVVGTWNLTKLERAVMRGRIYG